MSTNQPGGNSIISQPFANSATNADHMVVMPDQLSYILPSAISISNVSGTRSNLMPMNNPQNSLNLLPYTDNNMGNQITPDSGVASSVVQFPFIPSDSMSFHQQDLSMNILPIDHAPQTGETEEYQDRSDFTPVVINHISGSLKPPKRRMSAYACYSRKVFPSVKARMEGNPRQSDIFRVIAGQWKEMSQEEKQPYFEEASKDKQRKKEDEQRYNSLRKRVERSLELSPSSLMKNNILNSNRELQSIIADHDIRNMATVFLSMNDMDLKSTIDILQTVVNIIMNNSDIGLDYEEVSDLAGSETHNGGYRCTFPGCNKVFNWKSNLTVHMRIHDTNRVRNCVCPEPNCGKRFFDQQHLKQHMLTHQKNQHIYPCPYQNCTKKYTTKGGLQLHIKSHHQIDKKYKCDYPNCERAFVRKTDLKIHKLRVHSDSKPYTCTYQGCDKSYVSQSELNRHYQTHKFPNDSGVASM